MPVKPIFQGALMCILFVICAFLCPLNAAETEVNKADLKSGKTSNATTNARETWEVEYFANKLPQESSPAWDLNGTAELAKIENHSLHIKDDTKFACCHFSRPMEFNKTVGCTFEARLKVISAESCLIAEISDEINKVDLYFNPGSITCEGLSYRLNTTNDFHVYRLTAKGFDFFVYVDGKLAINGKNKITQSRWQPRIVFGSGSSKELSDSYWQYVKYTTGGAFAPGEDFIIADKTKITKYGFNDMMKSYSERLPKLGRNNVAAQILRQDDSGIIWLQNATAKVMPADRPAPAEANNEVKIKLARNEDEPFQIAITPKKLFSEVNLSFSDLVNVNDGKIRIGKEHLRWNIVKYVPIPVPSQTGATGGGTVFGEAGLMFDAQKSDGPGWYPDVLAEGKPFAIEEQLNYPLWITIHAPADIPAGIYDGKIEISGLGSQPAAIKLRVEVWNFDLPKVFHTRNAAAFEFFDKRIDKNKYIRNFAAHHFATGPAPSIGIEFKGEEAILDTTEFDSFAHYMLDELGVNNIFFPNVGWNGMQYAGKQWAAFKKTDANGKLTREFSAAYTDFIRKVSRHLKEKGWFDKVRLYLYDEPFTEEQFSWIRQLSGVIKETCPNVKIWLSKWPIPELIGNVDVWCLGFFQTGKMKEALARGEQLEWYPNWHPLIDRPGMNTRMVGWAMWKYNLTGLLLWNTVNGWERDGEWWKPWVFPCYFYPNGRTICGSGLLIYPDEKFNPLNSIRLELYREALEDYEYLFLLDKLCNDLSRKKPSREQKGVSNETRKFLSRTVHLIANLFQKKLSREQEGVLREARNFLTRTVDLIVPCYEAFDDKPGWKRTEWNTDEKNVYEAREKIAAYIQTLMKY